MSFFYKSIARPFLFSLSADTSHQMASSALRFAGRSSALRSLARKCLRYDDPILGSEIGGIFFPNPVGLAAGFDPNGDQSSIYSAVGFGFATIGSVTAQAQPGNPRPHFMRLKKDRSLIVNKGLMNKGANFVADQIRALRMNNRIDYPLGISIARTTKLDEKETAKDYAKGFRTLTAYADYVEINVSCPNVAVFPPEEQLSYIERILREIAPFRHPEDSYSTPVWLKLGPDLSDEWNERLIKLCLEYKVDAIVLTNLAKDRSRLSFRSPGWQEREGGISGKLLAPFSEEKLKFFYKRLKGKIPIVSVGGIFTAEDVYRRICLGASLVQMLTGWIYEGPTAPKAINRGLVRLLQKDGFVSLIEAVGSTKL